MGILNDFERRLEGVIEGVFGKAFRTSLQPVEMAKRILKEMEANKTVGIRQVWVPNGFLFGISPPDRERFQQTERALRRELEQVVRDGAKERGWALVGPPEVQFDTDESLREGQFTCQAVLIEGEIPEEAEEASTPEVPAPPTSAELVLIEEGADAKAFPLERDVVIIGRLGDSDVVLPDPEISRRHAEVRRENGEFVLQDLGSTNGTLVNDEAVKDERTLREGDRIGIGGSVLEFRRR